MEMRTTNNGLYIYNHNHYAEMDYLYSLYLRVKKWKCKEKLMTQEDFIKIKEIAKCAYPDYFETFTDLNLKEFMEYCCCVNISQLDFILEEDFYIVIACHYNCIEIVDCASRSKHYLKIMGLINKLMNRYKNRLVYVECRESTSYPLFLALHKHNKIRILEDTLRFKNNERLHFLKMDCNIECMR